MKNTWRGGIVINVDAFLDKNKELSKEMYDKYFDKSVKSYEEVCRLLKEDESQIRPSFLNRETRDEIAESIRGSRVEDWEIYGDSKTSTLESKADIGIPVNYTVFLIHDPQNRVYNPYITTPSQYRDIIEVADEIMKDAMEGNLHMGAGQEYKKAMEDWRERNVADDALSDEEFDNEMKSMFGEDAMLSADGMDLDAYLNSLDEKYNQEKEKGFDE